MSGGYPTGGMDGLQAVYSKFLTTLEYPASVPFTMLSAWRYGEHLNQIMALLSPYMDTEFADGYEVAYREVEKAQVLRYDDDYLDLIHHAFQSWFDAIVRLFARLGLEIPTDMYIIDTAKPPNSSTQEELMETQEELEQESAAERAKPVQGGRRRKK